MGIHVHKDLIEKNQIYKNNKPLLKKIYGEFYELIAQHLSGLSGGKITELGSGIGNIQEYIPECIRTDLFPAEWIDQIENAYSLSFEDGSLSDLIMIDVFHHLRYPGTALKEFHRVLMDEGHAIILDPCISLLGRLVYGIHWSPPDGWSPEEVDYYAAQGNATRIFLGNGFKDELGVWERIKVIRLSAIAYVASGGYSRPQFYPDSAYPLIKKIESVLDNFPAVFATRMLVVLEK
jgi:SAM-dependent methyltransferase